MCRYRLAAASSTAQKLGQERLDSITELTPNINAWYERLYQRQAFKETVLVSAQLHAGTYSAGDAGLPAWLAAYFRANGAAAPGRARL